MPRGDRHNLIDDQVKTRPQEHDIKRFEALHRFGPLPTNFLHELVHDEVSDLRSTRNRLMRLASRRNTAFRSTEFDTPFLQRCQRRIDSRVWQRNDEIYDLTPASKAVLKETLKWQADENDEKLVYAPKRTNSFLHNYFSAFVMASIYLATLTGKWRYYYHDEIRRKLKKDSLTLPDGEVEPDPFCMIENLTTGGTVIYPTEVDCDTERAAVWKDKLARWVRYFDTNGPSRDFGPGASVVLLCIFNEEGRKDAARRYLREMNPSDDARMKICFRYQPGFWREEFRTPKPDHSLFLGPWEREWKSPYTMHDK